MVMATESSTPTLVNGDRVTISGSTFVFKEQLRTIGLTYDGARKVWTGIVAVESYTKSARMLARINTELAAGTIRVSTSPSSRESEWLDRNGNLRDHC
jgi:hypothetical protein